MPAPTISSISADEGPTAGGTAVVLTGTNLDTVTDVDFFDAGTAACSFAIDSPTQITIASMPAHARAIGTFLVTNPSGNGQSADSFTYDDSGTAPRVTGLSPSDGDIAGGTIVTISGLRFTGATAVDFGFTPATSFAVDNDSQITATAPAHFAAGVYVKVTVGGEDSPVGGPAVFAYTAVEPPPPPPGDVTCLILNVPGFTADTVTADVDGVCYTVQAIDGWFDSPPVRSGTLEALGQGETITVARENARSVDVVLLAHTLDRASPLGNVLCFTAIQSVKTAFRAVFVPVLMEVVDPGGSDRTMLARRVGPIKSQILGNGAAVQFHVPMLGENPVLV